jgi:uncharacterized protein YycO
MKTDHLKVCDILLYRGTGFTSWLIQAGSKSQYSHVAVVVDPEIFLGIESNTGHQSGVRAMDLRKADDGKVDVFRMKPGSIFDSDQVISFLVGHLGAKYDWTGVISLGALKAVSFATGGKFQKHNQFQKDKDYFCSELVYQAFQEGGLDIVPQIGEAEITSPGDIARSPLIVKVA